MPRQRQAKMSWKDGRLSSPVFSGRLLSAWAGVVPGSQPGVVDRALSETDGSLGPMQGLSTLALWTF